MLKILYYIIYLFLALPSLRCCTGFSLVAGKRAAHYLRCTNFSFQWLLLL